MNPQQARSLHFGDLAARERIPRCLKDALQHAINENSCVKADVLPFGAGLNPNKGQDLV